MRPDIDPDKKKAIELGEAAGEAHALEVLADGGIAALAATLQPRPYEAYAKGFYELWGGGPEPWQQRAQDRRIAYAKSCPPYYYKAFDQVFARGARRLAEMLVRGFLDARSGLPLTAQDDGTIPSIQARLELMQRRAALGNRKALIDAYETGHKLFSAPARKGEVVMANGIMASAILATMKGDLDWDTVDARVLGVSSSYTFAAAHDFLNDVTNIITDVVAVTGEAVASVSGGANFDFNDPTLTNVNGACAAVYCYDHNGGADSARKLLIWWNSATGLPTGVLTAGSIPLTINASGAASITSSPS